MGFSLDLVLQFPADRAGADDQHLALSADLAALKTKKAAGDGAPAKHRQVGAQNEGEKEQARDVAIGEIERTRQSHRGQQGSERQADKLIDAAQVAATIVDGEE